MTKRTIIEIANRVGVSPATVSRALNNVPGVSADKRRRILDVAEELNYHPNAIARSLQGRRTNTVAYISDVSARPSADLFFFKDFVTALAECCARYGIDLLIHPFAHGDGRMNDIARSLRSGRADGLILTDIRVDDERVRFLLDQGLPFVAFGRCEVGQPYPFVDVDGEWGICVAVCHLLERGHTRIGFLGLPLEYSCASDRYVGYQRALAERGLPLNPNYVAQNLTNETEAGLAMERLLALPEPPTAFVAASDMLALNAMGVAARRGMIAGRDYAITGFDDLPLAAHTNPPLTTLRQPLRQASDELIAKLVRIIAEEEHGGAVLLRPELIVRGTT
jgi:DNA-binding LacI/PurR family transcriptional regulator